MNHRNDSSDLLTNDLDIDQQWCYLNNAVDDLHSKLSPSLPEICSIKKRSKFSVLNSRRRNISELFTCLSGYGSVNIPNGKIDCIQFINGSNSAYYVFYQDGTFKEKIEPAVNKETSQRGLIINSLRTLLPTDDEFVNSYNVPWPKGTSGKEKQIVRGSLSLHDEELIDDIDTFYVEDLKLFVSKNPYACQVLTEENHARVLKHWISDKDKLLNVDLMYKLVIFVNTSFPIVDLYHTSDGKLFEKAFVIRSPIVPEGEAYCRVNSYSSDDKKFRNKPKTISLNELETEGGVALDHTLIIGTDPKNLRDWCIRKKYELRYVSLSEMECDDFSRNSEDYLSDKETISKLRSELKDLNIKMKHQEEVINAQRRCAQNALNDIGKPSTLNMRDACKRLEEITNGSQGPKKKPTINERIKSFSESVHGFYKSVDGIYKGIVAVIGLCTLLGGLMVKFKRSG